MIKKSDLILPAHDNIDRKSKSGDVGLVHCYKNDNGFDIETVTAKGDTIAVLTLITTDTQPFNHSEILHSKKVTYVTV